MKKIIPTTVSLIALALIILTLSGCAFRSQRIGNTATTAPSQPTAVVPTTAESSVPTTSGMDGGAATDDTEGQELLDLVDTLDAENQAGDSLEDLP